MNLCAAGLITIFASVLQALTLSQAGHLPSVYTEGVLSGMAVAGILSSTAAIISTAVTQNQEASALCFFIIAAVITLFIIGAYYVLEHNEIFRNKLVTNLKKGCITARTWLRSFQNNPYTEDATDLEIDSQPPFKTSKLIILLWAELLAAFMTSLVTLGLFPGLVAQVRHMSHGLTLYQ